MVIQNIHFLQGDDMTFPNRDNQSFPDEEQERREQARQEHDWASGKRSDHPSFTRLASDAAKAEAAADENA